MHTGVFESAGGVRRLRVVSLGGGTGQPALIAALRRIPCDITAIVAMADDGRSTGILRREEGMLPPGDLRKCIVALAREPEGPLARALEHRFSYLDNHALGNLLIAALADEGRSFCEALACCEELLECVGRALPSTLDDVALAGRTVGGEDIAGQAMLSYAAGRLERVWLEPDRPRAYPTAVEAILEADLVVLGPGSLFTSLAPNLLVPGILDAVRRTGGARLFICPKADVPGETEGMDAEEYVEALERMGMEGHLDAVLLHRADAPAADAPYGDVELPEGARGRLARRIGCVLVRDLGDARRCTAHDTVKLSSALTEVIESCHLPRR